ncbi:MAG: choice-of-anchor Q domain-containing protein, partial [Chitinophagaceae bacterium]
AYTQSFAASGGNGSGDFNYVLSGILPAGLSFSGNTLAGTPTQAGSFIITVAAADPTGCSIDTKNYTLLIAGNAPASVAATSGTPQSTFPASAFTQALQVVVKDAAGNVLPGVKVIFSAPETGASGTFVGALPTDTLITDANGLAIGSVFTANEINGNYLVMATVNGVAPASFHLSNFCPATFVVTSNADSGPGTLREILSHACPGVTVLFAHDIHLIKLTSGELSITRAVTIHGSDSGTVVISGNGLSRIFEITADTSTVNISGLTLADGFPDKTSDYGGGAILINAGFVNLSDCLLTNNDASVTRYGEGGAIDNEGGTVSIDRCSFVHNVSVGDGGAITNFIGSMAINNSTITGNTAGTNGVGGGIYNFTDLTLTNCTIIGNSARFGGNIRRWTTGSLSFKNTIIAGGLLIGNGGIGPDIDGANFLSGDYNFIGNTTGGTVTGITAHNITGLKPNLLPLDYHGGTTPVFLPMANSPVINAGDPFLLTGTDQRGLPRVVGRNADIGAVETNYTLIATSGTPQTTGISTPFALSMQARITESGMAIAGDSLFFLAPSTGAGGSFPGPSQAAAAVSDAVGMAIAPVFTANTTEGQYMVSATMGAEFPVINYSLTNITGVLPVIFGSFTARLTNCEAQLQWKTYTEQNARDFTVEYSSDGIVYGDLATVAAKGNTTGTQTYNYTHSTPAAGTVYYRIRQTDINGHYTLGEVITVLNTCRVVSIATYPNPVKDKLIVQIGGNESLLLTVHDVAGRQMTMRSVINGRYEIDAHGWAKGLYTLSISGKGKVRYSVKVIKE